MADEFLTITDLAARLDRQPQTIRKYRIESKPGHRYADSPFPQPDRTIGNMPVWNVTRLSEIKEWLKARPGMGAGGGWHAQKRNKDRPSD